MTQQHFLHLTRLLVEDVLVVEDGVLGLHEPGGQLRGGRVEDVVPELGDPLPVAVVIEVVTLISVSSFSPVIPLTSPSLTASLSEYLLGLARFSSIPAFTFSTQSSLNTFLSTMAPSSENCLMSSSEINMTLCKDTGLDTLPSLRLSRN